MCRGFEVKSVVMVEGHGGGDPVPGCMPGWNGTIEELIKLLTGYTVM
jgi:hypothetical protein